MINSTMLNRARKNAAWLCMELLSSNITPTVTKWGTNDDEKWPLVWLSPDVRIQVLDSSFELWSDNQFVQREMLPAKVIDAIRELPPEVQYHIYRADGILPICM
jgi:hypothetical protein